MQKKCPQCGKVNKKRKGRDGNAQKFCSLKCRNRSYYDKRGGAQAQRDYLDKRAGKDPRERIKCLICGRKFRQVGTHIVQIHGVTAREYREEYGFDVKRGQLPSDYRELKAEQAIECGGVKNLKKGRKFWFKKGKKGPGIYKRSLQTLERLKKLCKYKRK